MEDFSKIHEEEFDYITARAVSQLPILCEISVKALKIASRVLFCLLSIFFPIKLSEQNKKNVQYRTVFVINSCKM